MRCPSETAPVTKTHQAYPLVLPVFSPGVKPEGDDIPCISIPALPEYRTTAQAQEPVQPMYDIREVALSPAIDNAFEPRRASKQQATPGSKRTSIVHPYARLFGKKEDGKRRKIWNHVLEKHIFSPYELSTLGAPHRRTIYLASLEAHIDKLHEQLLSFGSWPVAFDDLEPFKGLNSKTAKSMVAGRQYEASLARLKILELQRANENLEKELLQLQHSDARGSFRNGVY
ncbi:hypothetical protein V5O48_001638 [Marasmius crinis-equi]|uniref:Uncharacterized protein n=1 Tax=Marasmius crinis-equi TaxID=585013 RepID=A0ABR3FYL3_9AGAR